MFSRLLTSHNVFKPNPTLLDFNNSQTDCFSAINFGIRVSNQTIFGRLSKSKPYATLPDKNVIKLNLRRSEKTGETNRCANRTVQRRRRWRGKGFTASGMLNVSWMGKQIEHFQVRSMCAYLFSFNVVVFVRSCFNKFI